MSNWTRQLNVDVQVSWRGNRTIGLPDLGYECPFPPLLARRPNCWFRKAVTEGSFCSRSWVVQMFLPLRSLRANPRHSIAGFPREISLVSKSSCTQRSVLIHSPSDSMSTPRRHSVRVTCVWSARCTLKIVCPSSQTGIQIFFIPSWITL